MEKEVWYGLLYIPKNKLLGFSASSNPSFGECCDVSFGLDEFSKNIWLVKRQEIAEKVMKTNTAWYNAGYESPENTFKSEDLKVVKITMEIE